VATVLPSESGSCHTHTKDIDGFSRAWATVLMTTRENIRSGENVFHEAIQHLTIDDWPDPSQFDLSSTPDSPLMFVRWGMGRSLPSCYLCNWHWADPFFATLSLVNQVHPFSTQTTIQRPRNSQSHRLMYSLWQPYLYKHPSWLRANDRAACLNQDT
jgi:hypothetical protein